jgi:predicted amidohydrolase YtcJ
MGERPSARLRRGCGVSAYVIADGLVRTCDGAGTVAEALAVRDGRIVAVGSEEEATAAAGPGAGRVSVAGGVVLPGLIDTHPHVMHFSIFSEGLVDLADAENHGEIEARFRQRAAETPAGEWVMATPVGEPHYFIRRSWRDLAEGELPDRHLLDRAVPDHPAVIQAWAPVTPNTMVLNTAGLRRVGIDRGSPDRVGRVEIEKEPDGEPSGRLHGAVTNYYSNESFTNELLGQMPLLNPAAIGPGTIRGMAEFNAMGVTTGYEGHAMDLPLIAGWQWLRSEDELTMRILCAPEAEPYGLPWTEPLTDEQFEARLEQALGMVDLSDEKLRIEGLTIGRGGPCWPGLLLMDRPYRGPFGGKTEGVSFVSRERAERAIRFCAERDLRLNIVTAGTGEHDEYLEDLAALGEVPRVNGRSWIVQHIYVIREDQARRFAELGLDATTSMSFSWGKGEMIRERIGEDALADLVPLQRLLDAGLRVACGTDWGPKNVFEQIALAVEPVYAASNRQAATRGIARDAALAMWTSEAAGVLGWEGIGTIEPGNHADLIVVDRDPITCPLDELPETRVHATLLGGEPVHGGLQEEAKT